MSSFVRSRACCTRPPFDLPDFPDRGGEFVDVDGIDTYVTGPPTGRGIFVVYDIFGRYPQTFYGADILALGNNSGVGHEYQVFVPDFYGSDAAQYSWYPPDTPAKATALDGFFSGPAEMESCCKKLIKTFRALTVRHPEITEWSLVGYCYGAEICQYFVGKEARWEQWHREVSIKAGHNHPFNALVMLHPGFTTDIDLAKAIDVPVLVLNSGEETQEEMRIFLEGTSAANNKVQVEWFPDQVHGWMSARGELSNEKVMHAFMKGYERVRIFLEDI